jgi:xanthine/uracil permease
MLITGIYMILWGLWLFSPLWEAFPATDTLYQLLKTIPEEALGGISTALGGMIVLGAIWEMKTLTWACLVSFLFWLALSVTLVLGNWKNPAWLGSILPCALSMYFYLNLSVSKDENLTHNKR